MDEFKVIVIMNETTMELLKDKNANYEKNIKIQQYLQDEAYFFKIDKSKAYEILKDVGVKESQMDVVYKKLTSSSVYYDLLNKGKINENDKNLTVKYSFNNLFNKSN